MSRRVQVISASPKSNLCPGTQHPLRRIPGSIRPTNQNKVISRRKFMRRISILMFVVLFCLISTASPQEQTKHSQFIIFDVPQAGVGNYEGTLGFSINQAGEVSGWYIDTNSVYHGYLRSPKGDFTTYNVTGGGTGSQQGTQPVILSNLGSVAGWYIDLNSVYHGFLRTRDGKITTFDAPGAGLGANQGTYSGNVSPFGEIAGSVIDSGYVSHGFLRTPDGWITTFDDPHAGTNPGQGTSVAIPGLSAFGVIAGYYIDANNVYHGFLRTPDGRLTTVDVHGAGDGPGQGSGIGSINSEGDVVGDYTDANNTSHAFVRSASGKITK